MKRRLWLYVMFVIDKSKGMCGLCGLCCVCCSYCSSWFFRSVAFKLLPTCALELPLEFDKVDNVGVMYA